MRTNVCHGGHSTRNLKVLLDAPSVLPLSDIVISLHAERSSVPQLPFSITGSSGPLMSPEPPLLDVKLC